MRRPIGESVRGRDGRDRSDWDRAGSPFVVVAAHVTIRSVQPPTVPEDLEMLAGWCPGAVTGASWLLVG